MIHQKLKSDSKNIFIKLIKSNIQGLKKYNEKNFNNINSFFFKIFNSKNLIKTVF